MKKFALFLIAILFAELNTLSANNAEPSTTAVTDSTITLEKGVSEAERIIDKYGGKIVDGFNTLVSKAVPYAKEGFVIAVKLQIAKGIAGLLPLIAMFLFIYLFFKANKKAEWGYEGPQNTSAVLTIVTGIIAFILFIVAMFNTYDAVLYLVAPEWFAIKDIIQLMK
jgi:uncharacterized membrane protein